MITINPVKFNTVKPISFGEGNLNNITPTMAILALQSDSSKINFQKEKDNFNRNLSLTQKADAVQSNPFTAIGYKFIKTINMFKKSNTDCCSDEVSRHINYAA